MGGLGQEKETKNLNLVDMLNVKGMNIEVLNSLGPPWEVD
jgi:hypothetical protein